MKKPCKNRLGMLVQSLVVLTLSVLLALPAGVLAGDHWLSRVTVKTPGKSDTTLSAKQAAAEGLSGIMATSSTAVFDITVSLDSNPQGDDDWTVNDGANDADQRAYEERIEEFANAVFQSTNGAHKIGRVTIYREGKLKDSTDILWTENCPADEGPRAHPSGFGKAGRRIWQCTNWPGSVSLMSTPKGSGYTMAHEWGHYAYGLYDEYAQEQCSAADIAAGTCHPTTPRGQGTDTEAIPAIMNNQWRAVNVNADYLEFSTENIEPYKTSGTNSQKRVFGESAWDTLTRNPKTDPKFAWLPSRTQYTTLTAPTAPNWLVSNDESTARSELDIRWVGDQLLDLCIDVSGSMDGSPLANAKTGANLLIGQITPPSALGVLSFASGVNRNFQITDIPDPDTAGVKADAQAAVNALNASGLTAMYDGLMGSLNALQAFDPNRTGVVYLLSDGGDNASSANLSSVITAYQAAGVPIISFAYGSGAPTGPLSQLAASTGGAYFQSPTTLPEIQVALLSAEAQFSDNVLLASAKDPAAAGTTTRTIPLDSTLASALINLSYSGNQGDYTFTLLKPDGSDSGETFTCEGSTSCSVDLDEAFFTANGYGDYQVEIVNNTNIPNDVTLLVSAAPSGIESYDIAVAFSSNTVNYPEDMLIFATVSKGGTGVTGLDVVAKVTTPSGSNFYLPLLDDGVDADNLPGDGIYSASIAYTENGNYSAVVTASNEAGTAQTTFEGINVSLKEDGTAPQAPPPVPIAEHFVRVEEATILAENVLPDDHVDDPAGGACTVIADDNIDVAGRIDAPSDVDCFTVVPSDDTEPMVIRVTSLRSGMLPVLTIYDHTGADQIARVDMASPESTTSSVSHIIAPDDIDPAGHVFSVEHSDPGADAGGYAVSAGETLISDTLFFLEISLVSGWNMISTPLQPNETDIAVVLNSIAGKYSSVWSYANGVWKVYDPAHPGLSDLYTMEAGIGYWVDMDEPAVLVASGFIPPDKSIELDSGWNLVGFNAENTLSLENALASIDRKYISVWSYENNAWKFYDPAYPGFSNLELMTPGSGFWINTNQACTWTLP
jgi:calcium-activated chloride channel regulator 3/4